jgi:5-methylcytosine-specific restriction endonuclease McrA
MERNKEEYRTLDEYYNGKGAQRWNITRAWLLIIRGGVCELCGGTYYLQAAHKSYDHFGHEHPDHMDDLELLCRWCHSRQHPHMQRQIVAEEKRAFKKAIYKEGFSWLKQLKKSIVGK